MSKWVFSERETVPGWLNWRLTAVLGKWSREKPKNKHRVIEMAQKTKVLAAMPDDLSSTLKIYIVEGET